MKKIFILILSLNFFGQVLAQNEMLTCPRDVEILETIKSNPNCNQDRFLELSTNDVFTVELDYFDQEVAEKIMLDDVSNPHWLAEKGIYELRTHRLCLENSCHIMLNECDTNNDRTGNNEQDAWCQKTANDIFEIQKIKIQTAVIENQKRKTRSTFREKFRAIEVRASQYFYPNLVSFTKEFTRFTEKVTAFIFNPLQ